MRTFFFLFSLVLLFTFIGCDPGDLAIKKLNRKDGTWHITSIHYEVFDSTQIHVVFDSTQNDPGDLIFFKTKTLNAFWDYYMVVADLKNTDGTITSTPGRIFFDDVRVDLAQDPDPGHNFPSQLIGLWTVVVNKRNSQEWSIHTFDPSGIMTKKTMELVMK
jgi:hypothetical protein